MSWCRGDHALIVLCISGAVTLPRYSLGFLLRPALFSWRTLGDDLLIWEKRCLEVIYHGICHFLCVNIPNNFTLYPNV